MIVFVVLTFFLNILNVLKGAQKDAADGSLH